MLYDLENWQGEKECLTAGDVQLRAGFVKTASAQRVAVNECKGKCWYGKKRYICICGDNV